MTATRLVRRLGLFVVMVVPLTLVSPVHGQQGEIDEAFLLLLWARNAWKAGDHDKAIERYLRLIERYPGRTEAITDYGWVLMEVGKKEEAFAQFEAVAIANPDDLAAAQNYVRALLTLRQFRKAETEIRALLSRRPADPKSRLLLADLYMRQLRYEDARVIYLDLLTSADEKGARLGLADAHTALGEEEVAGRLLSELRIEFPDDADIAHRMVINLGRRRRFTEAYRELQAITDPSLLGRVEAELMGLSGRHFGAERRFRELLKGDPLDYDLRMGLAESLVQQGDYDRSEAAYRSVLRDYPADVSVRFAIAKAVTGQRRYETALGTVRDILTEYPNHPYARALVARLHRLRYEPDRADALLGQVADSVRSLPEAKGLQAYISGNRDHEGIVFFSRRVVERGMYDEVFLAPYLDALVLTGKLGEGREAVAALLARDPADSFLAVRLAEFYRLDGERRRAVAVLEESPDHGEKAEVYYRLKAYRKSAQLYADILAEDPTNVPAFIGMIRGLSASGEREAARRELMAFFDAAPSQARPALAIALGAVGDGTPRYYYILADLYRAVVGERPDDVDLKIAQLNLSARRERYAEAAAGYRSLIEERPYNPLLRLRLARLLSATRDRPRPETVSAYDDYLGIKPYDVDAWREKARFYGWVFDRARARAEYERIVELYPDHVESALEKQAQEAFWRGRHRLAHQRYSDLLEREPDNTHALFLLGQISSLGSRPAEAQAYYRRLLAQAPGHRAATTALGLSERSQRLRLPMSAGYVRQKGFDDRKLITYQPIGVNGDFALSGTVSARAGYQKVRFDFDEAGSFTSDIGRFHLGYAANHFLQLDGFLATLRNDEINQDNLNFGARLSYEWLSGTRTRFEFSRRDLWENRQTVVTSIHVDKFAATVRHPITDRIDLGLSGDYARYSDDNERINAELSASYKLFLFPRVLRLVYNYNGFGFSRESVYFSPDRYATNTVAVEFRHFLGFPSGGQYFSEAPRSVYSLYYAVSRDRDNNTFHEGTATLSYGLTRALSLGGVARIIRSDVFREDNFSVFVQSYF